MTETKSPPVAYRQLDPTDESFVYNSFLKSFRDSPMVRGVPNTIYFVKQHEIIEKYLANPDAQNIVACNPEDPSQIYGYILGQTISAIPKDAAALHWVYVKQPFRNWGIARALYQKFLSVVGELISLSAIYYTHRVKTADRLLQSVPHVIFNPFIS